MKYDREIMQRVNVFEWLQSNENMSEDEAFRQLVLHKFNNSSLQSSFNIPHDVMNYYC